MSVESLTKTLCESLREAGGKDQCVARNWGEEGEDYGGVCLDAADEIERLRGYLTTICGKRNHLAICDRAMGDSHACTCGTRAAMRYLAGLPDDTPTA